jgi:hypothetical protein
LQQLENYNNLKQTELIKANILKFF